jgi:hypothetical protein
MREMFSGLTIDREAFPSLQAASKGVFKLYVGVIEQAQARGQIRDGDPRALAGVLWLVLHGVALLMIENQFGPYVEGPQAIEGVIHLCVQTLYHGLGCSE